MQNPQLPTDGNPQRRNTAFQPDPGLLEALAPLQGNERIRQLLKCFGLRTSLVRLKVIDALLTAAGNDRRLGVRGMH
ncbi:fe2+ zn2+ uptake regulation protein, partial [Pseudomonas sp. FSL R10-0071]|nr:fe2+ zn2+ uptake regulation protein [Pseudomonas sp. FSL R10-0071]